MVETILLYVLTGLFIVGSVGICVILGFTKKKTLEDAGVKLGRNE